MAVLNQTSQNASGQTLYTSGATQGDVSSAISAQNLKPVSAAVIPPAPIPTSANPAIAGANAAIAANTHTLTQAELDAQNAASGKTQQNPASSSGLSPDLQAILDRYAPPVSTASIHATDEAASGIDPATTERNANKAALGSTLAQIQGITAQAEAEKLAQENTFGTTGNTIGQQAQIDRNYAIKALPLQVQALVQQAALSNSQDILDQAQKHLDTIFQIHSQDATNEYNYKTKIAEAVYNYADKQRQAKIDELKLKSQQDFSEKQTNISFQRELAGKATEARQGALAASIMSRDPNSPTFAADLAADQAKLQPKNDVQFVAATATQPAGYFDNVTHTFTPLGATGAGAQSVVVTDSAGQKNVIAKTDYNERQDTINLVNQALNDPYLKYAVGGQKLNPLNLLPGNKSQNVKAILDQVTAKLALDNRSKLKGSGAISDFESRTLQQSASSFNTSLPYADAQKQLAQIKGVLTTLNGGQAQVLVTDPKTKQTSTAYADTAAINKAISAGYVVQYQ